MRVLVAGATGAIGRQLVPQLLARDHEVVGMTTRREGADELRGWGANAVIADALDAEAVGRAVSEAAPEAIVHQLTALTGGFNPRRLERDFALTNRLRTEATDHLLSAGRAAGVRRFCAQSFAGWPYARTGGAVKSEDDPLDPEPPRQLRTTLDAIRYLEGAVLGANWTDGIVLRYGGFYGPGTSLATDPPGELTDTVRRRRFPLVGDGGGVWSFIHVEDGAAATVAALEHGSPGLYNVVDDEPAPVREWLPALAAAVGAKPPMHVPRWVGRLAAGEAGAVMMTEVRGASNEKAKRELDWRPRHRSWRQGFVNGTGDDG
jgi:nucleoside-diphosphate-sugar epimerase